MKRYERMSKEDIVKVFQNDCIDCPVIGCDIDEKSCAEYIADWLNEEINIVPRFQTIKTAEEMEETVNKFVEGCVNKKCHTCKYSTLHDWTSKCFAKFLCEEIEVEVTDG